MVIDTSVEEVIYSYLIFINPLWLFLFPESPVDVPGHQTAEVPGGPVVMAPVQEGEAVVEEIQQVIGTLYTSDPNYWNRHCRLTLLHSERPKLNTILAFLSAIGLDKGFPASQKFLKQFLKNIRNNSLPTLNIPSPPWTAKIGQILKVCWSMWLAEWAKPLRAPIVS